METSRKKAGSGKRAALTCALSLAAAWAMTVPAFAIDQDIVILHTNDIHCGIKDGIGYSGLALCDAGRRGRRDPGRAGGNAFRGRIYYPDHESGRI